MRPQAQLRTIHRMWDASGKQKELQRAHLRPGATVFDVGANVGAWAQGALLVTPDLALHAFEPDPDTFRELAKLPAQVIKVNAGVGAVDGAAAFCRYADSCFNSFLPRKREAIATLNQIPIVSLDSYCRQHNIAHIDFCKIDAEGYEFAILQGGVDILRNASVIQFEWSKWHHLASLSQHYELLEATHLIVELEPTLYVATLR